MIKGKLAHFVSTMSRFTLVGVGVLTTVLVVKAADYGLDKTARGIGYSTQGSTSSLYEIIGTIITAFLGLLGFVFFGLMLYSGLRWMLARGNQEFVQKAKDNITSSIIGLTIILAAYAITRFVFGRLGQ